MYIGFSAATGSVATGHYILGWSFSRSGEAQSFIGTQVEEINKKTQFGSCDLADNHSAYAYNYRWNLHDKEVEEILEDWQMEYGPQRFSYKELHRTTKGFKEELIGSGGFGKVYRGITSSSNAEVAVKSISHESNQGMKEFVAEIASIGRLRHRNLVQLQGYYRRKGELLLVYDYMPNGSLDKFLFGVSNPRLS